MQQGAWLTDVIGAALLAAFSCAGSSLGQTATVIEFPDPALFYQNTTFAVDGDVAYVPTFDNDTLWSFSTITGVLLDKDGLALPAPGTASDAAVFANEIVVVPGWFPLQAIFLADASDPSDLQQRGVINFPGTTNIQGQNIEVDDAGVIGFIAGFPDDKLYSFNVQTMSLEDPDGLALPGNPDRIARANDRVAIVDTTNGRILVADVGDPADLTLAGVIELPGTNTFGSNDNIVFADDGRTGFVTSNERVLYSFDVIDLVLLDPDGLAFGTQSFADGIAISGDTVACIWSRGLTCIDVSNPSDLTLISNADFGGTIAPQGNAAVAFSADGTRVVMDVIFPDNLIYAFDVITGDQVITPFAVDDQPNFLTRLGSGDRIGVLCSGNGADNIWLIDGIFGAKATATLTGFEVVTGTLLEGELADLEVSDDLYVHARSGFGQTFIDLHHMEVTVTASTATDSPTFMDLAIESRIDEPAGTMQVRLRNWSTGVFDLIGTVAIGDTDGVDQFPDIDATDYVNGSGEIELSIKHLVFVNFFAFTFESRVDLVWVDVR